MLQKLVVGFSLLVLRGEASCGASCCSCLSGGGGTGCASECNGCTSACQSCVQYGGGSGCLADGRCSCSSPAPTPTPTPSPSPSPGSQVRGTWIPTSFVSSEQAAKDLTRSLAAKGVTRLYVDVWNNGRAYFDSPAIRAFAGDAAIGPDHLAWFSKAARALEPPLEVYAWFEYGFMACYGASSGNAFAEAADAAGWLIGEHGGWQWMDPAKATPLLEQMLTEATSSAYAGILAQLDDHFACPAEFAQCTAAVMDAAAVRLSKVAHSLSPAPLDFATSSLNVGWDAWAKQGLFAEFAPQLYTASSTSFTSALAYTKSKIPSAAFAKLVVGVRVDGSGSPTTWAEVDKMLDTASSEGVGVCAWYANGITNLYPDQFAAKWSASSMNQTTELSV